MKRLAVVLSVVVLLLAFASVVNAGTQGGCGTKQAGSVQVWENYANDHSFGDDNLWIWCSPVIPYGGLAIGDFYNFQHTLPGLCNALGKSIDTGDNWDNCISGVTVWLPSSLWVICFYDEFHFYGQKWSTQGPRMAQRLDFDRTWTNAMNDKATSLRIDNDGSC